jgi:hypothetical protein
MPPILRSGKGKSFGGDGVSSDPEFITQTTSEAETSADEAGDPMAQNRLQLPLTPENVSPSHMFINF